MTLLVLFVMAYTLALANVVDTPTITIVIKAMIIDIYTVYSYVYVIRVASSEALWLKIVVTFIYEPTINGPLTTSGNGKLCYSL